MKTKLTPERQERICGFIRAGNYAVVAAGCSGITEGTYYHWLKLAEKAKSGIYYQFSQSIKKAQDDAEAERVMKIRSLAMGEAPTETITVLDKATGEVTKVITKHARPEWTALAWLLERQHPERWGKKETVTLTDPDGEALPAPVIQFNMPDGVQIIPPRNGDKGNGSGTVTHRPAAQSSN